MHWRLSMIFSTCYLIAAGTAAHAMAEESSEWKRHVVAERIPNATAVAADFTGDGRVDVISNSAGKSLLFVAPNWNPREIDAAAPHDCIHAEVMDVDGNGRPDFIGAGYSPGVLFWLENSGDDGKTPWTYHLIDDRLDGIHGVMIGDIDGDGQPDLAANSAQPKGPFAESLAWYRRPQDVRKPWERHIFAKGDAPGLSHYLGLGDVNGDGRTDAATGAKGGPTATAGAGDWFAWWEAPADPTQTWKKHVVSVDEPGATNILMADINADGKTDFFASRGHDRGVVWYEGPDWRRHDIHAALTGPHCLASGDIDGDGDPDAVTCAKDDRLAVWFENDGRGAFTSHVIATNQAAYDIRLVDMNGDGTLDVLIAGQASENVVWLENPK